jgi:hypothetical protein
LNEDFLSLGIRFVPSREALIVCAVLYPVVIVSTYFSSQDPLIAGEYPLSKGIGASWTVLYSMNSLTFFTFYRTKFSIAVFSLLV